MTHLDEDLHDLLLYAAGFVTAMVLYTRARAITEPSTSSTTTRVPSIGRSGDE